MVESMTYLVEAGNRLIAKKDSLARGEWLPWLETNAEVLGFESRRTASRLMAAALQWGVNAPFEENEALRLNRVVWGNEKDTMNQPKESALDRAKDFYRTNPAAKLADASKVTGVCQSTASVARKELRSVGEIEAPKAIEASKPTGDKPKLVSNGRLSSTQIADYETQINAPSIYPEDLPFPVHPDPSLNAHLHEAFVDLKANEPQIARKGRTWLYNEIWTYTQRIQSFSFGNPHHIIADMDPRWVQWAKSVARKVRLRESIILDGPKKVIDTEKPKQKISDFSFEKLLKEWTRALKQALRELSFAPDQESRILQVTEQIIGTYFEERRTPHARLAPSPPTGEPTQLANGSPSLNREQLKE